MPDTSRGHQNTAALVARAAPHAAALSSANTYGAFLAHCAPNLQLRVAELCVVAFARVNVRPGVLDLLKSELKIGQIVTNGLSGPFFYAQNPMWCPRLRGAWVDGRWRGPRRQKPGGEWIVPSPVVAVRNERYTSINQSTQPPRMRER